MVGGYGEDELCNHVSGYPNYKPDEKLEIVCKILRLTTDKVVWDMFHEINKKLKAHQDDLKSKLASMETKMEELQNAEP